MLATRGQVILLASESAAMLSRGGVILSSHQKCRHVGYKRTSHLASESAAMSLRMSAVLSSRDAAGMEVHIEGRSYLI